MSATFRSRHNRGSMMTTDIKKRAQLVITAANQDDRLAADFSCDVIAGIGQLVPAGSQLPGITEDCLLLKFENALVGVPGGGNC